MCLEFLQCCYGRGDPPSSEPTMLPFASRDLVASSRRLHSRKTRCLRYDELGRSLSNRSTDVYDALSQLFLHENVGKTFGQVATSSRTRRPMGVKNRPLATDDGCWDATTGAFLLAGELPEF